MFVHLCTPFEDVCMFSLIMLDIGNGAKVWANIAVIKKLSLSIFNYLAGVNTSQKIETLFLLQSDLM